MLGMLLIKSKIRIFLVQLLLRLMRLGLKAVMKKLNLYLKLPAALTSQ